MSSDNDNKGNEIVISKDRIRKFQNGGHQHVIPMHQHEITPGALYTHWAPLYTNEEESQTYTDPGLAL